MKGWGALVGRLLQAGCVVVGCSVAPLWLGGTQAQAAQVRSAEGQTPASSPAQVQAWRSSPYDLSWGRDLALTGGALLLAGLLDGAVAPTLRAQPGCRQVAGGGACDPAALARFDRVAVHHNSRAWRRSSDVLQPVAIGLSALAGASLAAWAAGEASAGRAVACEVTVQAQAVATATLAATLLKFAVHRPRPALYRVGGGLGLAQGQSFPSGHTTAVAASLAALATGVQLRAPRAAPGAWAWGAAATVTAVVAAGRVLGGKHFPSDVVAGAALGGVVGYVVPQLHRRGIAVAFAGAQQIQLSLAY